MTERLVSFNVRNVPASLRTRFKVWCVKRGVSMTQAIIHMMREKVENPEQRK